MDYRGFTSLVKSQALADKLHERLGAPVALSMRYGKPAIADGLQVLHDSGVTQVCIVPFYPHYADSTITTSVNAAMEQMPDNMQADVITPFYQAPEHTKAWGENIRKHLPKQWDHLLFKLSRPAGTAPDKGRPNGSALPKTTGLLQCQFCGTTNLLPPSGDGNFTRNRPISRH